jgi:hypothetical protein
VGRAEPERELIRRILPFAPPAAAVAFAAGAAVGGLGAGWSAAIGIGVVVANFVANAWSVAWAARISPTILMAVGLGGFVVRLGVIAAAIALLQLLDWFSVVAFVAALVPATVALLSVEMKLLSGRMQADLWTFPVTAHGARR